jgi:cytochrome c-type biogenesis protein CcmF
VLKPGGALAVGPYVVRLEHIFPRSVENYREDVAVFAVLRDGEIVDTVEASKRLYLTRNVPTTEAGILTLGVSQVYASLGEPQDGGFGVRLYWKPFVLLIWLGAVAMAAGGALSLTDRRLRVGAPARQRVAAAPLAAE